jgi:3-dehydroquinate synthase
LTEHQTIHVNLADCGYDIDIGSNNLHEIGLVAASLQPSLVAVITDQNVEPLYAQTVVKSLEASGCRVTLLSVEPGEATKSIELADRLWKLLLERGADRKSLVVAVGGGVVGDLAGFVAATFARGIAFVQVPTTLLAQVDSSVGGKVGVNLPGAKNMVGAFWQPYSVLIDIDVLSSLPDREYRAGLAEVVKYGVILDAKFFSFLESKVSRISDRDPEVLQPIVSRCCQIKGDVVEADEREATGQRAKLNYGHTFCHAIEAVTGYGRYLHGEAVAIGMNCASRLAESLGRVPHEVTERQGSLLEALGLPLNIPSEIDRPQLLDAMRRDKKAESGQLRFILPVRVGCVELVSDVSEENVLATLG